MRSGFDGVFLSNVDGESTPAPRQMTHTPRRKDLQTVPPKGDPRLSSPAFTKSRMRRAERFFKPSP
jgi:hypothetical protein